MSTLVHTEMVPRGADAGEFGAACERAQSTLLGMVGTDLRSASGIEPLGPVTGGYAYLYAAEATGGTVYVAYVIEAV